MEGTSTGVEGEGDGGWEMTAFLQVAQNSYCKQRQAPSTAKAMDLQLPENGVDRMLEEGKMQTNLPHKEKPHFYVGLLPFLMQEG